MPIWLETISLMLAAYGLGLGLGWALWGREPAASITDNQEKDTP